MDDFRIDQSTPLPGTVKYYQQHLIVCSGHSNWPAMIEESGGFITALTRAVKATPLATAVRITACDAPSSTTTGTDVLLYPRNERLVGLTEADIPALLQNLHGHKDGGLTYQPLRKPLFLICGHRSRDIRCGNCGPDIEASLKSHLAEAGLDGAVDVWCSSHLGGHRFAGVMVSYPSGNWYGRVTPNDIPAIIQAEVVHKQPLLRLWRGQMDMTLREQKAYHEYSST